jgi:beta-galactosidase
MLTLRTATCALFCKPARLYSLSKKSATNGKLTNKSTIQARLTDNFYNRDRVMIHFKKRLLILIAAALSCWPTFGLAGMRQLQSLDGTWDIIFDHKNEGRGAGWHLDNAFSMHPTVRQIQVPSCWEEVEEDYEGVAFYRRKFKVPESWTGKTVRLQFGAVNYLTEVWLNDEVVGFHEGGFTPFEFRVDSLLTPGQTNTLILRVAGPIILQDKRIDGMGPLETPQWRGGITGGIWQSVRLVATGEMLIRDVFIEPHISNDSAKFHLELENTGREGRSVELETTICSVSEPNRVLAESRQTLPLRPGVNKSDQSLEIPNAHHWSPESPYLYRAQIRVLDGAAIFDEWTSRFGMREFTIRNKQFHLNGKPLYLKATFFEGLYPVKIAYPDSREMAAREIQLAKDAGFNMIRPWRRPPAPMWLDLADEMGVLVVGSHALECMRLPLSTPYLPSRVEHEIRQAILRDRNRACVVQWELFNELHRPILKQMMRPMAILARELDPTRLILDESGGWAFGAQIYLPYQFAPTKFNDIHNYPGPFINERLFNGFLTIGMTEEEKKSRGLNVRTPGRNVVPGLMSFVSELGYGSLPNLVDNNKRFQRDGNSLTPAYRYYHRLEKDQKRVLKESGFGWLYPDLEKFCLDQQAIHGAANKRMIEAVRSNPDVSGYCIHALAAGDWILGAGLIDLWRQPKSYAYEATKAANQPRILCVRMFPRNVYAEKGSRLQITGVNELEEMKATLTVHVVSKNGEIVLSESTEKEWSTGVSPLFERKLETHSWRGNYTVKTRICAADGSIAAENTYDFDVFGKEDLTVSTTPIAVLDSKGSLTRFLRNKGADVSEFDSSTSVSVPVLVTNVKPSSAAAQRRFVQLLNYIEAGGTAVYIQGVGDGSQQGKSNRIDSTVFPFSGRAHAARGLWTCIPHLVSDHPVFAGLPNRGMMRDIYENVWATQTLRDLGGEAIVASIGFDWFSADHKMHYSGPGESWWGADLAVVPHGKGRSLVSQLRIVENLGKDPVADKILFNIVEYAGKR